MANGSTIMIRETALDGRSLIYTLVLLVVGFLVLFPVFTLIINSFQINEFSQAPGYGTDNWLEILERTQLSDAITNTMGLVRGAV